MRTAYVDNEGFENRRHLLRLWLTSTVNTHAIDPARAPAGSGPWRGQQGGASAGRVLVDAPAPAPYCISPASAGFPREAYLGIYADGRLTAPLDAE